MSAAARARRARQVRIRLAVLVIAIAIAASVIIVRAANRWSINMTLNGDQVVTLNLGEVFDDPGATATAEGSTRPLAKKKLDIRTDGEVNNQEIGTYTLTYSASYEDVTESVERTVEVVDTEPPVIDLVQNPDSFTVPGEEYEEEGYSAYDNYDGDLTSQVKREEENGIIHYEVTDSSGNRAVAERAVIYDDKTAPEITLEGGEEITVQQGTTFTDEYSATDDVDGDLTDQVEVEGEVDVNTAGDYTLKYIVKDSHDNIASAERVVHVKRVSSSTEGYKLVYLTFDDGPGPYTEELLDILDRYNVKATFFVTNGFPKYQDLIGEEARRGHAVAVHTYCHDYDVVYQSDEAFWEDFDKMNDIIEQQTGQKSDMMRFPGGSSNTVSRKYSNGIMTRLTEQAEKKGYAYFDWNVLSGDAGDTQDSDEIVKNMIDGISERNTSIILCHDIHDFTVNAMDDFLSWATENGYTFAPLTKDSYTAHQGVNN